MRERQPTPSSNPGLIPDPPKLRLVYADGTPYEEVTLSKRKYENLIIGLFTGWIFFGITFIYLIFTV
jgi:hypothetical protein